MSKPKVLIVDDEAVVREIVGNSLGEDNYDLHFAENGKAGLEVFERESPGVIILDLRMPVMDGHEFLRQLQPGLKDPFAVIVLTGHGEDMDVRACFKAGITAFLRKPFNHYELRGAVSNALSMNHHMTMLNKFMDVMASGELEQARASIDKVVGIIADN